ncbi:hypothetical protein P0O24_06795 [Methanotrichaceae archaeon M04Ac]|uniref:Restriction endonuclease n=1 Tax=Candidatus Methanocrinis alkalitolerans TaxID=3033395 RepID=A0ABT5XF77_9EURY|nr:hypothetical protein [Candidatus Methanocrinis alkalitolerans]MDF0593286.1 hypothetical protein [Candidatus Methanocrinis alkalitolerans]
MKHSFKASWEEIEENPELFVSSICTSLQSQFLVMPKGNGFIEYPIFERGYEELKQATNGFTEFSEDKISPTLFKIPISIIVLRSILGFTPPEWAYITTQRTGIKVDQGFARSLDRKIRMNPFNVLSPNGVLKSRLDAMIRVACQLLSEEVTYVGNKNLHRLDKADTRQGLDGVQLLSTIGAPYAMLLYERFLGRPFASHRDSVSELVGDTLESAIEDVLTSYKISYRKTKRAERIPGFDQAPDFIIPSEYNPQIIIEAKITEDDGTARDKVTRIQHLSELSMAGQTNGVPKYEVIACIDGRGFGVRREDVKKMLLATRGKVFTFKTLSNLVEFSRLKEFAIK